MSVDRGWMRALGGVRTPTAVVLADGRVVVTGTSGPDEPEPDVYDRDDVYDPATGRFMRANANDLPPADGTWILLTNAWQPWLFRFDPATDQRSARWEGSSRGDRSLNGGSAWLLSGDRLLIVTGADVSLHDLVADASWTAVSAVTSYRRGSTATALADGRVLIAGGTDVARTRVRASSPAPPRSPGPLDPSSGRRLTRDVW